MFKNLSSLYKNNIRVLLILSSMLVFSIIYMIFPDEEFSGVNNISEMIKRELLKEKIKKDIKEKSNVIETFKDMSMNKYNRVYKLNSDSLDEKVEKIESQVEDEYTPENVQNTIFQQYFSRLYFSIITGCLLGYGDVYPVSIYSKTAAMIQSLITIIIIVS